MTRKDVTGDGKYTQKDLLVERGVLKKEGNKVVKARKGKSINLVCPRKEMAGALEMPRMNKKKRKG
tara:strand:+ start:326 stop:523 length:198 start_codon:yes stop_codon:yes gene_type:complete